MHEIPRKPTVGLTISLVEGGPPQKSDFNSNRKTWFDPLKSVGEVPNRLFYQSMDTYGSFLAPPGLIQSLSASHEPNTFGKVSQNTENRRFWQNRHLSGPVAPRWDLWWSRAGQDHWGLWWYLTSVNFLRLCWQLLGGQNRSQFGDFRDFLGDEQLI